MSLLIVLKRYIAENVECEVLLLSLKNRNSNLIFMDLMTRFKKRTIQYLQYIYEKSASDMTNAQEDISPISSHVAAPAIVVKTRAYI